MDFGDVTRAGRSMKGWNQQQLAEAVSALMGETIIRTAVTKIERGREPRLWEALGIATVLGFSLDVFKPGYVGPVTYRGGAEVQFPKPPGSDDLRPARGAEETPLHGAAKQDVVMQFPDPAPEGTMERAVQEKTREEQIERGERDG